MNTRSFPMPTLLLHPNIPKPLHGVNPRSVMGKAWWDEHRWAAYATNAYRCWACNTHKRDAAYHNWLEGHESYIIDFTTGRIELKEIVALCHACHNYIHSGRLQMLLQVGKVTERKALDILYRGREILLAHGLDPNPTADRVISTITETPYIMEKKFTEADYKPPEKVPEWGDWHLVIDGQKHYSRFADIDEWAEYYANV